MKKIFTLFMIIVLTGVIYAQSPQKMSYQFVVRNTGGALVTDHAIGLKLTILQGSPAGTVVYQEIFNPNPVTNANGLASIEIGTGLPITGIFSAIDWAAGPYYLKTETDPTGATNYTVSGTSQLLSVPYALHSKMAEETANNSVTTVKIADGAVVSADLADGSVTSAKISDGTIATVDLGNSIVTTAKLADGNVTAAKLAANSVDATKIVDLSISTADLANSSVTTAKIADGTLIAADLADGSVTSAKILDGTIAANDILDRQRNIVFPSNALNFDKGSLILTQTASGITWKSDYSNPAFLTIAKPPDWLETTNVTLKLYFMVTTNSAGVVSFFIRPRSYNEGETYGDAASLSAVSNITVPASSIYKIYSQTFSIPYSRFGTKNLWVVTIQREGTGETYVDDLIVMSAEIIYTAVQ